MRTTRRLLWGAAIGVVALATCADPFGFDNSKQTPAGGGSVAGPADPAPAPSPPPVAPPVAPPPAAPPTVAPPPVAPPPVAPPPAMNPPVTPPPMNPPPVVSPPSPPAPQPPPAPPAPPPTPLPPPPAPVPIAEGPACDQPAMPPASEDEEACPENIAELAGWFPRTPPVQACFPKPHPFTECPFYQFGFQHFLIATQPDQNGQPDFLNTWSTIENTFGEGAGKPHPAGPPILSAGVTQAGQRQILVDVNLNPIYYGIHFNKNFVAFVNKYQLTTVDGIKKAPPELQFPTDVVELKSAWQIVNPGTQPNPRMIRATVRVPTLRIVAGTVTEDFTALRTVTAQMLAIHVVFTIPGHPEFIWSTFEAVDANDNSLVAPSALALPPRFSMTPFTQNLDLEIFGNGNFALFPRGGRAMGLNVPTGQNANGVTPMIFNETTQKFAQPTPVHRVYRGSLSHETDLDEDVVQLNEAIHARFNNRNLPQAQQPNRQIDRRGFYTLVGAIWLDIPKKSFGTGKILVNDPNDPDVIAEGPESPTSITGGEDRLSSTAMESFTQPDTAFANCFTCHDPRGATAKGVPFDRDQGAPILIEAKQINVSHVFAEFVRLSGLGLLK